MKIAGGSPPKSVSRIVSQMRGMTSSRIAELGLAPRSVGTAMRCTRIDSRFMSVQSVVALTF